MNNLKILLAEDDVNLGFVVKDQLLQEGHKVKLCIDGQQALESFATEGYDICLLDVMLPKKDGFTIAQEIKKLRPATPIIFITAKEQTDDKLKGFEVGADDYITKPFDFRELKVRMEAVLRRVSGEVKTEVNEFKIGKFTLKHKEKVLFCKEEEQKLSKKEATLLKIMAERKNEVLPREMLLNFVWGKDDYFTGRSMDVFISKLRKYLSTDSSVEIENVHGIGFKLKVG